MTQRNGATCRISAEEAARRSTNVLVDLGSPEEHAAIQASHLVEAELRGHPSHGLRRLEALAARIASGVLDPTAEPDARWVAAAAVRVDGRRGFGPVAAYCAIDILIERIGETGVAVASLHRTHHLGMLAPYVERLSEHGALGMVFSSTEGLVHPWGGSGALLGTNPVGIGIPAVGGDFALDMSTGAVSAGKILDYRARGLPLPDGWAVDRDGHPTTDASAAVDGAISPFGGPKGYALGLAFGSIVAALTGTALGADVRGTLDADLETTKGDVIVAFDATLVAGVDMRDPLGAYFARIRSSGVGTAVPGDRARAERARREDVGLDLPGDVLELLEPRSPRKATNR